MRTCSHPGCKFPVFGTDKKTKKGYCRIHQFYRTDLTPKFPLRRKPKRTTIKSKEKFARNARLKHNFDPYKWGFNNELEMFADIWISSDKKSKISGRNLRNFISSDLWYSCFAHVLNKNHFPLYKYNPYNIMLIHPYEHYLVDMGSIKERVQYMEAFPEADFNIFYDKQERFKSIYRMMFN